MNFLKILTISILALVTLSACSINNDEEADYCIEEPDFCHNGQPITAEKPVIYLYPEEEINVEVKLDYKGEIIADYPNYDSSIKGWKVNASPDGTLINKEDGLEYSYIFWEGVPQKPIDWNLSEGFVVKGSETKDFLQEMLPKMGMQPKEYNEFIVYWYPRMKNNPYNLIHFAQEQYTQTAPLNITPKPDSMLRVFMVFKPLEEEIQIKPQEIDTVQRGGFFVLEWGGAEIK